MIHYYNVNEIFNTIQSEGHFAGTPSVFIRLQGCDVGCPWCDTAHTWNVEKGFLVDREEIYNKPKDQSVLTSQKWAEMSTGDIFNYFVGNIFKTEIKHVVITGGEPCLQDLSYLISHLEEAGFTVQIETSGTEEIKCTDRTWVTLSPKIYIGKKKPVLESSVKRANEIKYVLPTKKLINKLDELLMKYPNDKAQIYLQPLSLSEKSTQDCMALCLERGYKLSVQVHKYLNIR